MKRFIWPGLLVGLVLALPSGAAAGGEFMRPGLWEITTTLEMPGMPFQPPPQTMRHCYTPQEVQNDPVPMDSSCEIRDLKTSGSKTTWAFVCKGEAAGTGEGEIVYLGDSAYEGWSRMRVQGMTMTTKYQGKRIGACK